MKQNVWIPDADTIKIEDNIDDLLYSDNQYVKEYLNIDNRKLGICASKGMGKTFLLKIKRINLEKQGSILCLPKDNLSDAVGRIVIAPQFRGSFFKDYSNWVTCWEISFFITIFMHTKQINRDKVKGINGYNLIEKIITVFDGRNNIYPSHIFNYLVGGSFSNKELSELMIVSNNFINLLTDINEPIAIFIDKIDQGFSDELKRELKGSPVKRDNNFWKYSQIAVAQSAYELFALNSHIKIYFSARPECFKGMDYLTQTMSQVKSMMTFIRYSKKDCEDMFNHYIAMMDSVDYLLNDESAPLIKRFTGFEILPHTYIKGINPENTFDYIYRHSFGNPRELMLYGHKIYVERNNLKSKLKDCSYLKDLIRMMSETIIDTYIGQLVNLNELTNSEFKSFALLFNSNVFSYRYFQIISRQFFKQNKQQISNGSCSTAKEMMLKFLNLGLIGILNKKSDGAYYIDFNMIQNGTTNITNLPEDKYFFFHPILSDFVRKERKALGLDKFYFFDSFIIEFDAAVNLVRYRKNIRNFVIKTMNQLPKIVIFLSSTCYDLGQTRSNLATELEKHGFKCLLNERNQTEYISGGIIHSHDACFDAVTKADYLVYLLDYRYGSPYSGNKYKDYVADIKLKVPLLGDVSISFMEIYSAFLNNVKRFHFVKKDISNELYKYKRLTESERKEYKPVSVDKKDALLAPDFINSLGNDNWVEYSESINYKAIAFKLIEEIDKYMQSESLDA